MTPYTTSSVPHNPTLRSAALNTVIVVPLLSKSSDTYSSKSFTTLFRALFDLNLDQKSSLLKNAHRDAKEVTLIIPNSNLTPPGDWRYDDTPLQSHDWTIGCQRLFFVDGRNSVYAHDRINAFYRSKMESNQFGDFADLYPGRGTAAVIGVLNVRDCHSEDDLLAAEDELEELSQQFSPILHSQKYWNEAFDSPLAPKHYVTKRMFIFDSFEDDCKVDLNKARNISALISFPPAQNMHFHLNVVINDLAVNIFQNLIKRIRIIDELSAEKHAPKKGKIKKIEDVAKVVSAENILNSSFEIDHDEIADESNIFSSASVHVSKPMHSRSTSTHSAGERSTGKAAYGIPVGFKSLAASAGKALWKPNQNITDANTALPPIEHELQTPLDSNFDESQLTTKDIDLICRRNEARRQKYAGDLALMAGSTVDAYERYTLAADGSKKSQDPLWYAAALEGIATSFVAMADTGGGFADQYLENNFRYPDDIMMAVLTLGDDGKDAKLDKSKTTMPAAVYALLQEATDIFSRNLKLSSLYSEILLKTAWYVAELEGSHERCLWGDIFHGNNGNDDSYIQFLSSSMIDQTLRRNQSSASKLDLTPLIEVGKLASILSEKSVNQLRHFTDLLHQSVSNGGIDTYTRAQIAGRCAKMCIRGVQVASWTVSEIDARAIFPLYRKAAFFAAVAAESISQCDFENAKIYASGFWLATSRLYSEEINKFEGEQRYGWVTLRSTILHGLSLYGGNVAAEKAIETLLLLLGECSEVATGVECPHDQSVAMNRVISILPSMDKIISLDLQRKQDVTTSKSLMRASFFRTGSNALQEQSKWVDLESVPLVICPFIEPSSIVAVSNGGDDIKILQKIHNIYSPLSSLICLDAVIQRINHKGCLQYQKQLMSRLANIRSSIPTTSKCDCLLEEDIGNKLKCMNNTNGSLTEVLSAHILKADPHLSFEMIKTAGSTSVADASLATFFNPYAKSSLEEEKAKLLATLIAQGEERSVAVEFCNSLLVPIVVSTCQLVFSWSTKFHVDAPPLSFTIPPKAKAFTLLFPFKVLSFDGQDSACKQNDEHDEIVFSNTCQIAGVQLTSSNRSFFLPFKSKYEEDRCLRKFPILIPRPTFLREKSNSKSEDDKNPCINLQIVPFQPNLHVSFPTFNGGLESESDAEVSVHISGGECFDIPVVYVQNDLRYGKGIMERLQISVLGLPGISEDILFDDLKGTTSLSEDHDIIANQSRADYFYTNSDAPPLKVTCDPRGLSVDRFNDHQSSCERRFGVFFRIMASNNKGKNFSNGIKLKIRFRYSGQSNITGVELWRKREINLQIFRTNGPRVSSIAFRTDLSWGSPFIDLCAALQRSRISESITSSSNQEISLDKDSTEYNYANKKNLHRKGESTDIFIASSKIVILMACVNEATYDIELSNNSTGQVGGFENNPIKSIRVPSGVSIRFPVSIDRFDQIDENGEVVNITDELIKVTSLRWESVEIKDQAGMKNEKRHGTLVIPQSYLRQLGCDHQSFASHIYKPPFRIDISIAENVIDLNKTMHAIIGEAVHLFMKVKVEEKISSFILDSALTLEFCCAEKNSGNSVSAKAVEKTSHSVWYGQKKKIYRDKNKDMNHSAIICFVKPGDYYISGCVRITKSPREEVWFAPFYQVVKALPKPYSS